MFIYPIYNHNWRNISTIYIYNKTSIKRNILTIKQIYREVGRAKDLSAPPINVSSITISALCIIVWRRIGISRRECLANTQNLTATLAHKQGRLFTPSSRGTNFSAGTILFFIFDKWMKDGAARHFGVVITKEDGCSGKLEKQVRRISITSPLWFALPNNSFRVMRRRGL